MPAFVLFALAIFPLSWTIAGLLRVWLRGRQWLWPADYDWFVCYALILAGVLLSTTVNPIPPREIGFSAYRWLDQVAVGWVVGLAWFGLPLLIWSHLWRRMPVHREVAGLYAPLRIQLAILLVGAFVEELWRALCLAIVTQSGFSDWLAVTACSVASGLSVRGTGKEKRVIAALDSAIFGGLFLWQHSLIAPFAAHLTLNGLLLMAARNSLVGQTGAPSGRGRMKCPFCQARLGFPEVDLRAAFHCPTCGELLQISSRYRFFLRCAWLASWILLLVVLLGLRFPSDSLSNAAVIWLFMGVVVGANFVLVRSALVIFPPKLQRGLPYFITLKLGRK